MQRRQNQRWLLSKPLRQRTFGPAVPFPTNRRTSRLLAVCVFACVYILCSSCLDLQISQEQPALESCEVMQRVTRGEKFLEYHICWDSWVAHISTCTLMTPQFTWRKLNTQCSLTDYFLTRAIFCTYICVLFCSDIHGSIRISALVSAAGLRPCSSSQPQLPLRGPLLSCLLPGPDL